MASHPDFVAYVAEQLREAGTIRCRKMFGEYGLYCDGVFFAVICDDQFFVKITPEGQAAFPGLPQAPPHEGARDALLVADVEDRETMTELTRITCSALRRSPRKDRRNEKVPFDYKKAYREFYLPPRTPHLITVPPMNFLAVRGQGDPNEAGGAYQQALGMLYAVAFTIKMGACRPEGFFDYVVPPLEGLWWQDGRRGVDYARKEDFRWISLIRLPEFVTREVFDRAVRAAAEKKQRDFTPVTFFSWDEGLCVQCLHLGPYDDEPATVAAMAEYAGQQGCEADYGPCRFHHEIYLSDARRCRPDRLRTVIRLPVRRAP